MGRQFVTVWILCGACVAVYAAAFRTWRPEWLHDVGVLLVACALPWVMLYDVMGLPGYWISVLVTWLGLAINISVLLALWNWLHGRFPRGRAA